MSVQEINGALVRVPRFQNKMGAIRNIYKKSSITNGKVAVKGIKTEDSLVRKYNKKGNFLQQKHSSAKKTQQGRDLYQGNCFSTTFSWKFTRNSSNTPVKGYKLNGAKLIFKCESQQFSSSKKAAIFCKTLGKIDKQARNFRMGVWSENRLHFGNISGKSSTSSKNVTTGILASDKRGGIYVEEGGHPNDICEKRSILEQPVFSRKKGWGNRPAINLKNLNEFIPYLYSKLEGLHLVNDMLKEKDYMCKIDLKGAYFSAPLRRKHWKYFQFCGKISYTNSFLCFGLGPTPRTFTKLLKTQ